jgi:hypothetical protein
MNSDTLWRLQLWYEGECDGYWEHLWGVTIETLDNPGWSIRVNLEETSLECKPFDTKTIERTDTDWLHCRVEGEMEAENRQFFAACGPRNLDEVLRIFLD